jgi:aspartyl-tRNA(Asn)/glutamyl-tRNA(Gln) amidotransferase subunit C
MQEFYAEYCYTVMQMTKLSSEDITKLAYLARIDVTEDEVAEFAGEFSQILEYVEKLQSVDVTGLQPTSQVTGLTNVTREDEIVDLGYTSDDLLKNVPKVENGQIKVKRMIG